MKVLDHPVHLDYLGLHRDRETMTALGKQGEDDFCKRLIKLGPTWYPSLKSYVIWEHMREKYVKTLRWQMWDLARELGVFEPEDKRLMCFPREIEGSGRGGGVWVLEDAEHKNRSARIGNARDMDELCKAIEMEGGMWHSNVQDSWVVRANERDLARFMPGHPENGMNRRGQLLLDDDDTQVGGESQYIAA